MSLPSRLDIYLVDLLAITRSRAQGLVRDGDVSVNGQVCMKSSFLVNDSDRVVVSERDVVVEDNEVGEDLVDVPIIFEDEQILVVDKPAGLVVYPGLGKELQSLVSVVGKGRSLSVWGGQERPGVVHRLDKDTSGLMVLAKTDAAFQHLQDQFRCLTVHKKYRAVVSGDVSSDAFTLDMPLTRHVSKPYKWQVAPKGDPGGMEAVSHVEVVKRYGTKTVVDVVIETGRTHQIRVHLAHKGFPLIGDRIYGTVKGSSVFFLRCFELGFCHPVTGSFLSF